VIGTAVILSPSCESLLIDSFILPPSRGLLFSCAGNVARAPQTHPTSARFAACQCPRLFEFFWENLEIGVVAFATPVPAMVDGGAVFPGGPTDRERENLATRNSPIGTRLLPMSPVRSVTYVSGLDT
jgi:hypothetical protein